VVVTTFGAFSFVMVYVSVFGGGGDFVIVFVNVSAPGAEGVIVFVNVFSRGADRVIVFVMVFVRGAGLGAFVSGIHIGVTGIMGGHNGVASDGTT
jgi:hypothetical protein